MFVYTAVAVPQVKAGRLRALAVAQSHRNEALPEVPTMAEAGYAGCEFHGTMLLLAPAGIPKEIVSLLNKEISAIMQEPEVRSIYATTGADPVHGTPEEVRALIARRRRSTQRWSRGWGSSRSKLAAGTKPCTGVGMLPHPLQQTRRKRFAGGPDFSHRSWQSGASATSRSSCATWSAWPGSCVTGLAPKRCTTARARIFRFRGRNSSCLAASGWRRWKGSRRSGRTVTWPSRWTRPSCLCSKPGFVAWAWN